jgi:hypothetical protein
LDLKSLPECDEGWSTNILDLFGGGISQREMMGKKNGKHEDEDEEEEKEEGKREGGMMGKLSLPGTPPKTCLKPDGHYWLKARSHSDLDLTKYQ